MYYQILFLFLFSQCMLSQIKITKVIDSNIYELNNGIKIKFAGIEAPSVFHQDSRMRNIASRMVEYSKQFLVGRSLILEYESSDTLQDIKSVFVYRKYLLSLEFYNEKILRYGYGRHTGVSDSIINNQLIEAEISAKKGKAGIWQFNIPENARLDNISAEPIVKKNIIFGGILFEITAGGAVGFMGGFLTGLTLGSVAGPGFASLGYALIGFYSGYVVSSSFIIYAIGKRYNPYLRYEYSLLSSLAGAATSISVIAADKFSEFSIYNALALPVAGSVIYVNLAGDPIEQEVENFKDIINRNSVYLELFRMNF